MLGSPRLAQVVTVRVRRAYPQVVDHELHCVVEPVGQLTQHMLYAPDGSASQKDPDGQVELPPQCEAEPLTLRTIEPTHGQRTLRELYEAD